MDPISYFQAIVLGLLQGFSELFPISSLGHSVVLPRVFGWDIHQNDNYFIAFLVATHLATAIVLLGFFWFVFCLQASDSDLVYTAALVAGPLRGSVFLHIGVTFPSGRPESRSERAIVLAGYLVFPLAFLPPLLFTTASTQVTAVHLMKSLPYDPVKDFTPIVAAVEPVTCLIVNSALPVNSVAELVAYAKARPGALSYAS